MKLAERTFRRKDYYVTSPFGYRKDPKTGVIKYHNGCDYGTNRQKWPQYALEDGTVTYAQRDPSGANVVIVTYPRLGFELIYGHLDTISVKKGQKVTDITVLGTTGMSGYATGIHLHLGKRKGPGYSYEDAETYNYIPKALKTVTDIAREVIAGKWGNWPLRERKLKDAGYSYKAVQAEVNKLLKQPVNKTSLLNLVKKTLNGDFGNGSARKKALGADYKEVQRQVNLNIKYKTTSKPKIY